ncbi:MAG: DegT/DnrJ/EryC1/StrS family aminotransferase [Planctomycetota bacterium]
MVEPGGKEEQRLALRGGMKAVGGIEGRGQPKIGVEEFMAVARRFGFTEGTLREIRRAVDEEDWGEGPFLANYYSDLDETCVEAFERTARQVFGAEYAIGLNSGTSALHAAFVAVGVGPGTEVICPAVGFVATPAAVVAAKGVPVFCDVDESLGMDPRKIEERITPRTVALAPTHVMGSVCDMGPIMEMAREHDLRVVEDCAQSCGATWNGRPVGTFGDAGAFSISAYKIVGGGEGGLLITDDERVWERANQLAECGGLWRPDRFAPPRYEGELFSGHNYRMSEMEAAVDAVQLRKLSAVVERFRAVKRRIMERLDTYPEVTPQKLNDADGEVGYQLRFLPETRELADRIARALRAEGVPCSARGTQDGPNWHHYSYMYPITLANGPTEVNCPYECPAYTERGGEADYARGDCPVADDLFDRAVSIPLNQWYTPGDCERVAAAVNKVLGAYCTPGEAAAQWL